MHITTASNPVYADASQTTILLDVRCEELGNQELRFLAKPDDNEEHGVNLFCRAMVGEFGPIKPYQAPEIPSTDQLPQVKTDLISALELELFKRLPVFAAYRRGVDAINVAATEDEARAALAAVQWPDGVTGNGVNRKHNNKK